MIDFRYHIVSIVAIFFALGAGVLLGAGPLKSNIPNTVIQQADVDRRELDSKRAQLLEQQSLTAYQNKFTTTVASNDVTDRLKGRDVALVLLPGADGGTVKSISTELQNAGANVSTQVTVNKQAVDPAQRQLVSQIDSQLRPGNLAYATDATDYTKLGQLLGRAIATTKQQGQNADSSTTAIGSGLDTADLVSFSPRPSRQATLVVVVASEPVQNATPNGSAQSSVDLAAGLDRESVGAVVAGPLASASSGGVLSALRSDSDATSRVSGIDMGSLPNNGATLSSGLLTIVYALDEQFAGKAGQYGVSGKDGVVPKPYLIGGQ